MKINSLIKKVLPDLLLWKIKFYKEFKCWPNLKSPTLFNEKVKWRMLHDQNYLYTKCADKYEVRDYIKKRLGEKYLIPMRYSFDSLDEITKTHDLGHSVVKANHGAGMVEIIHSNYNLEYLKKIMDKWLNTDYSKFLGEKHYQNIKRKIIVEESLCENGEPPIDYKFHCFKQDDESVKVILQLVYGRFNKESRGYYLEDLETCIWSHGQGLHQIIPEHVPQLKEAISLSKILCEDFNYVRVDWYISKGQPFFGELTFTPGAGSSYEFGIELEKYMCDLWNK